MDTEQPLDLAIDAWGILPMRRFQLLRSEDVHGLSGVGVVAEGFAWEGGPAVLRWSRPPRSVVVFDSIEDVVYIHGHEGRTRIRWIDMTGRPGDAAGGTL